jgi:hypothetical protein
MHLREAGREAIERVRARHPPPAQHRAPTGPKAGYFTRRSFVWLFLGFGPTLSIGSLYAWSFGGYGHFKLILLMFLGILFIGSGVSLADEVSSDDKPTVVPPPLFALLGAIFSLLLIQWAKA